jgi:hypothetical protein
MVVTNDKYELPLAVFDTIGDTAQFLETSKNTIYSKIKRARKGIPIETELKVLQLFI